MVVPGLALSTNNEIVSNESAKKNVHGFRIFNWVYNIKTRRAESCIKYPTDLLDPVQIDSESKDRGDQKEEFLNAVNSGCI